MEAVGPHPPRTSAGSRAIAGHRRGRVGAGCRGADPDALAVPYISLRTRRSLRAVHFHPHGAPMVLSAEVNETSEHDVPPLRATMAPLPAGEWETAYAAASAAAAAAMGGGGGGLGGGGHGLPSRGAESGADGGGSRTTYIAARSSDPGSPVLSSQPSADADDLDELARLRVRSPANAEAMDVEQPTRRRRHSRGRGRGGPGHRGRPTPTTARQQLFQAPGASTSTAAAAAATAAYQSARTRAGSASWTRAPRRIRRPAMPPQQPPPPRPPIAPSTSRAR